MSNKQIKTALRGYEKQVFPPKLEDLNIVYDDTSISGVVLEEICKGIKGFDSVDLSATTADGYVWFAGLNFRAMEGGVAALFPWALDRKRHDGTDLDRSIATYVRGKVNMQEVNGLVLRIYQEIFQHKIKSGL